MFDRFTSWILRWRPQTLILQVALEITDQSTVCVFFSSEFIPSFLNFEMSLSFNRLLSLNCKFIHLDSVELVLSGRKCHIPSLGPRHSTAQKTEMQVLMLQHGNFYENLAVAAATVPRESFAADEKLRDSFLLVISPNISGDMVSFELHPSLGEHLCPRSRCRIRSVGVWSNDSTPGTIVAATSVIKPEEDDIELIPESPCIDTHLCEVRSANCSLGWKPVGEGRSAK